MPVVNREVPDGPGRRSGAGLAMTDDRLRAVARAAGYAMIPPQDACDCDSDSGAETAAAAAVTDTTSALRSYVTTLRARLPSAPGGAHATAVCSAVANWFQSRAPA